MFHQDMQSVRSILAQLHLKSLRVSRAHIQSFRSDDRSLAKLPSIPGCMEFTKAVDLCEPTIEAWLAWYITIEVAVISSDWVA
jgi:hypothetical protein